MAKPPRRARRSAAPVKEPIMTLSSVPRLALIMTISRPRDYRAR